MQQFAGIWVPLITPFNGEAVDYAGLSKQVDDLSATGIAGVVVCGTTGEAAALDERERRSVLESVIDSANGLKVVIGVSAVTPDAVVQTIADLEGLPLTGALVPPPYYVRPSQAGIEAFYAHIADSSPFDIVLYDIPARAGVRIETDTMVKLSRLPRIRAVKD